MDGTEYRLSSFRGRYVLLDFWAVACAPCRDAMPALEAIHREFKDRGLLILGIDVGEERLTVETFLKKTPAPYPTLLDTSSDVAKLFHVDLFPTFILIDPDGKVVDWQVGFLKAGANSRENIGESQLRRMLREGVTRNISRNRLNKIRRDIGRLMLGCKVVTCWASPARKNLLFLNHGNHVQLAAVQDGEGTLLDNAMFLYGSNMSSSDRHDTHPLPTLLIGGAGGKLSGSRHLELRSPTPIANLHLTLLGMLGIERKTFGDSTGTIAL